jgi:invasion protein IalB
MSLTRKEFLRSIIGVAAGAAGTALLVACSSSSSTPDAAGATPDGATARSCTTNGTVTTIGANHGHVLMVSKADVIAGVDKVYDITGGAAHAHSVTITAALFTMLKNNTTVTITSTSGGNPAHTHGITITCI